MTASKIKTSAHETFLLIRSEVAPDGENIFAIHPFDKGLVSKKYKEFIFFRYNKKKLKHALPDRKYANSQ